MDLEKNFQSPSKRESRVGSCWPPPFWGTQIVNIFSVPKACKGGDPYLEVPGPAGSWSSLGWGQGVLGDGYPLFCPLSWGNSKFSALIDFPRTAVPKSSLMSLCDSFPLGTHSNLTPQLFQFPAWGLVVVKSMS